MNTIDEIKKIHEEQYCNFIGKKMINLGILHFYLRKEFGDEKYLEHIKQRRISNPKPKYEPPSFLNKKP